MVLKRRSIIRIISFAVAIAATLSAFIMISMNEMKRYKTNVQYNYDMQLSELDGSIYNISLALRKAMYATSATQLSTIAAELCAESTVAKNSLSQLPAAESELTNVNKFLSQVGDYAVYLSKKVISGKGISAEERENIHILANTANKLSETVGNVRSMYGGGMWTDELSSAIGETVSVTFSDNLLELEEMLSDYPSLLYDGPFSDHKINGTVRMLEGKDEVSIEAARATALSVLGGEETEFTFEGESEGKIATYDFSSGDTSVSVTKCGGYVVYMRKYREIGEQTVDYASAVRIAEQYLNSAVDEQFTSTYYFADEGVCVVNLAYKQGDVVCYSDLIKVGIALDTGEVVLLEAAGYITNHYYRRLNEPKYSAEEADKALSQLLEINDVKQALIPTDGIGEKLCYEYLCKGIDGEEILVYINVENLEEERILLLLKTDGGTLTK